MVKISAIVTVYNGQDYLEECLASIFVQTMKDMEIIVSNDGSTDGTRQILERYRDKIVILDQPHQGVSRALNNGIAHASGDYVAYLAHDDWWEPKKLSTEFEFMEKYGVGVVYSDFYRVYPDGSKVLTPTPEFDKEALRKQCFINISSSMIDRRFLNQLRIRDGHFFDENLVSAMDWDLWIRLSELCAFHRIPIPLAYYRLHAQQWSQSRPGVYRWSHLRARCRVCRRYNGFDPRRCARRCLGLVFSQILHVK